MNIKKGFRTKGGFTLVELLIVIAIIALIVGIVIASITASREKAADVETMKVVSEVALRAESKEIAPGVIDYEKAFVAVSAPSAIAELAGKLNLLEDEYQAVVSPSAYAIVFPLKRGGYYCVDSLGHANGMVVEGLFSERGEQNCATATRSVGRPIAWGGTGSASDGPIDADTGLGGVDTGTGGFDGTDTGGLDGGFDGAGDGRGGDSDLDQLDTDQGSFMR